MTTYDGRYDVADHDAPEPLIPIVRRRIVSIGREVGGDDLPLYLPSFSLAAWGGWLVLPFHTFAGSPAYAFMDRIAQFARLGTWGEPAWGVALLVVGVLHAVLLYQRHPQCALSRSLVVSAWIFLGILFQLSSQSSAAWAICGGYALLGHWGRNRVRPFN